MKVAIIGSRNMIIDNIEKYLPENVSEIVSGGAKGVDSCARDYAVKNNIKLTEFLPEYKRYGKNAPIIRNNKIIDYSDIIIVFWDGESKGTKYVINECKKRNKNIKINVSSAETLLPATTE